MKQKFDMDLVSDPDVTTTHLGTPIDMVFQRESLSSTLPVAKVETAPKYVSDHRSVFVAIKPNNVKQQ